MAISVETIRRANANLMSGRSIQDADLPEKIKRQIIERRYSAEEINAAYARSLNRGSKQKQEMSDHDTFGKLVQNDKDFIGMVAYTIYKKEKNNWKDSFKQREGRDATYTEIRQFFNVDTTTVQKVDAYRKLAEDRLNIFIDETTTDELIQYKKAIRDDAIVDAVHSPWWKELLINVGAGIVGAALVSGFSIFYWLNQVKEDAKFQKQFNEKIAEITGLEKQPNKPPTSE